MGFRRFSDPDGRDWEVRPRSKQEWEFEPVGENPGPARVAAPPGHETDPFELSIEELQRLLEAARPPRSRAKPSPFKD